MCFNMCAMLLDIQSCLAYATIQHTVGVKAALLAADAAIIVYVTKTRQRLLQFAAA